MTIEWSEKNRVWDVDCKIYLYKSGLLQINRAALLMIRENDGDLLHLEVGYDSEKDYFVLKPVKEQTAVSYSVSAGSLTCTNFFRRHNFTTADKPIRRILKRRNDYYIFYRNEPS